MAGRDASKRLVRNTLANGFGGFAAIGIGVVLAPFMISELGLQAYGVYTLALTLSFAGGYAAMSDLGIEQATVRYVAEADSDDNRDALNETVATTFVFFVAISVVLAAVAVALAPAFVDLFSVRNSQRDAATVLFALIGGQLIFEMPARAFTAVLEGTQQFITYQAVELSKTILIAAGTVGVLVGDGGLAPLGIVYASAAALTFAAYWVIAHRMVPGLRAGPSQASRREFKRLLTYGTSVFAFRLTGTIYRQMDKVILGVATSPAPVALYEIANKLHLGVSQVHAISTSALTPAAAGARRDRDVLWDMYVRGTRYTVAVCLPVTIGAMIFAEPLLRDWIGPEAIAAVSAAHLLLTYLLITAFHNVGTTMLVALGRVRHVLAISIAMTLINLVASIALVGPLGIRGVVLGTVIASVAGWGPLLVLCFREFGVQWRTWLKRILLPQLPGAAVQVAVGFLLLELVDPVGNLALDAAAVLVSIAVSLVAFAFIGSHGAERAALFATVGGALGRSSATPDVTEAERAAT